MIKHLESAHVENMPVPWPNRDVRDSIGLDATRAIALRRSARKVQQRADDLYESAIGSLESLDDPVVSTVRASVLAVGRRRLDAQHHRGDVEGLRTLISSSATRGVVALKDIADVSLGNRFKRFFSEGEAGTPYRSAGELFDVNPPVTKRIFSALLEKPDSYMLDEGWIVMACSGQTYGLLGRTKLLSSAHRGIFGSHDLIRIIADEDLIRPGYLQTVLNHERLGRPLAVSHAYGTSIPHLDPVDIRTLPIPRFAPDVENEIASLTERSVTLNMEADELESMATDRAEAIVAEYLANPR
ncbi:hypothetical protein [Frigoribacterium sp. Leaf172]|uniref:hypothetical protein n=1 Tax=Frigoribacterium sp. Leaf172 TaxID=1736285 RepID=UPI0012E7DD4E|nr:hypothetical protein [Frigoribacterium sp. Leaf172]